MTSSGIVYAQGASEKAEHSLVRLDVMNGAIEDLALKDASKKGVVDSSDSLASSEDLPTGKAVADYVANQIAGKTSIAYVIDSSSSSGANAEFNKATSSSIDYFDIDSYSSKSLSTVSGETITCSDMKVGDIVYTKDADVKDWFLGAKTDSKLTFYQISADTATLSGYVQKSGSEMTGTLKLKNSDSALSVSGPADFSSSVTISGKNFNYSGIEAAAPDSAGAVWFSDSAVKGKPVYDAEFTYNPKSNELYVGSVVEGGTALSDKYEAKGHTHDASLKDSAGNDVSSLSANTKYKLTAGGDSVTFTTPKDSDTHYTNSLAVEVGDVQAVKFSQDADKTLKLIAGDNVKLSATAGGGEIKISSSYVDTDTTYSFAEGDDGGTFEVTPSGGKAQTVQTKAWDASIGEADASDAVDQDLKLGSSYKITAGGDSITFKMPESSTISIANDGGLKWVDGKLALNVDGSTLAGGSILDDGTVVTPLYVNAVHVTYSADAIYPVCASGTSGAQLMRINPNLSMSSSGVLTAAGGFHSEDGNIYTDAGDIYTSSGGVYATGDIYTSSGDIYVTGQQDIFAESGNIYTSQGDIYATSGNIYATAGNIDAGGSMSAGTSLTAGTSITAGTTITAGGEIKGASFDTSSDARLKENLEPLERADGLLDMPLYEFDYREGGRHSMGCLAQDLRKIAPELVSEGEDGYLQVKESKLVYYLMLEVKELRDRLAKLEGRE